MFAALTASGIGSQGQLSQAEIDPVEAATEGSENLAASTTELLEARQKLQYDQFTSVSIFFQAEYYYTDKCSHSK